jgi:glutaminase
MKQGFWLVVAIALVVGGTISVVDLEARETTALQAHDSDKLLVATDLNQLQRDAMEVADAVAGNREGKVYTAAVEGTDPDHLALAVALVDGRIFSVGEAEVRFPLMSVSKPFTYALALEQHGVDFMIERIGVSATGFPYNAVAAGAVRQTSEQNPLVNAGAIATHGYIEGATPADKVSTVIEFYSRMANRPLSIEKNWRVTPRALTYTLAYQMKAAKRLEGDVEDVAERFLESNIVAVTVEDLARMGATLATGGIQPQTGERILKSETVRTVLSVMVIAGMYEDSGLWWTRVGLPAKSGVSGAILAVVPGWGAIVAYSPRLDEPGNSVRGALAIRELADRWGLHSIDRLIKLKPGGVSLP